MDDEQRTPAGNGKAPPPDDDSVPHATITLLLADDGLDMRVHFDPPWNNLDEDANPITHWAAQSAVAHITELARQANAEVRDEDEGSE